MAPRVAVRDSGRELAKVAKASGLNIPSGCTFGVCGTCRIKKLSGEVHMVHNVGISEDDIEAGHILAGRSNPIGHVPYWPYRGGGPRLPTIGRPYNPAHPSSHCANRHILFALPTLFRSAKTV